MYTQKRMSLQAIANVFHVSHICIRNWLLDQDVKMRRRGRPVMA